MEPTIRMFHGGSVNSTAETNATSVIRTWRAPAQPVVRAEGQLPPWHFFKPTLYVSFGEWKPYARRLRCAIKAASDHDDAARRRAKDLINGIAAPRDRMLAIRDEVLRTIRPEGPSFLELPPDSFSSPDRTLADQYGHPADRAILLASMLDAAGFDARIVFVSRDTTRYPAFSQPSRDVPQLGCFAYPLVVAYHKGTAYYLNEGDQYDELGTSAFDGAYALALDGKTEILKVSTPLKNREKNAWTIDLDESGTAAITITNWYFGTRVGAFRKQYREMLPEDFRRHHLELIGSVSKSAEAASALVTETTAYPGFRTFGVKAENYAVVQNGTLTLLIPEVAGAIFPLRADTRVNPLFLDFADTSELTCRIILPVGYTRLQLVPESRHWMLPCGFGTLDYDVQTLTRDDMRVEVQLTRRLARCSGEASPELYPALLEYNRRFTHPSVRTLVVERAETCGQK